MKVCSNGSFEVVFSTTVSLILVLGIYRPSTNANVYWAAFILAVYAISLFFSLSIYAIYYQDGIFTGKSLLGRQIVFRPDEIAEIKSENMSKPPRAKIILDNGKSLLIKKPMWMEKISKQDFVKDVRARFASAQEPKPNHA
jgi:hypothetical protein